MIQTKNLSLIYKSGKGIFDINLHLKKASVTGYLGPNGAGKTTTIRVLMGFMKSQSGQCSINGLDCFLNSDIIKNSVGYIPGEISFLQSMTCREHLKYIADLRKIKDTSLMNSLIDRFDLDTKGNIKNFSKGMKQKVCIVSAFMHNPDVLILDEPTSGLDPLMQNEFTKLILEEKRNGKTILMSSHIFEEVEKTADEIVMIKDGRIVKNTDIASLNSSRNKIFTVKTLDTSYIETLPFPCVRIGENEYESSVKQAEIDAFVKAISQIKLLNLNVKEQSLEDIFFNLYKAEGKDE